MFPTRRSSDLEGPCRSCDPQARRPAERKGRSSHGPGDGHGSVLRTGDECGWGKHPPVVVAMWEVKSVARRAQRIVRRHSRLRSEEHTSELQSLRRTPYAVFCLKKQQKK